MLEVCLNLAIALNQLSGSGTSAARAEQLVLGDGRPHHVHDPDQLLGLDPLHAVPLRQALARIEHGALPGQPAWALLLPRPGRMAGLRGPAELNAGGLERGAVVCAHDGSLAWLATVVGAGVQWRLVRAERPLPAPDPRETARMLSQVVAGATSALHGFPLLDGSRPEPGRSVMLGAGYPARSQTLLDRALLLLSAAEAGLAQQHQALHSHAALNSERHLRELAGAALDGVSAAVSWPQRALDA
ncbi:hypothetical protein ACTQ49_09840 [Luteococcus sp. Sow4_B9]|uniref:hypothetical protein n=1 Tax=Luteococcus sp. Sow4_B9 TaxID=3438792 RepID=UPI003F9A766A